MPLKAPLSKLPFLTDADLAELGVQPKRKWSRGRKNRVATRILRKAGFNPPKGDNSEVVLPAEAVGTHGLRPTWHGKA